ncbi:MAG TPA: DUF3426 domain-containing protein [Burkholderiales bacterium]|nr:DUF3426 domain-containing protein [Burkholderiales bacterium]
MKMITRCPACGTAFRVQADQLAAREGQVRCGQCSTVFDAQATLVTEPEPDPVVAAPQSQRPAAKRNEALALVEAAVSQPLGRSLPPVSEPSFSDADAEFEFGPAVRGSARLRTALWGLAALAALLALAGQVIYAYRGEIAVMWPESRPWLAAACRELRCAIPLPQHAELISIESSELAVERGASGVLTLSAVLRNRAGFAQALPALELTLTDGAERPLARRVLYPKDYLGERAGGEPTLPPGGEAAFRLHIDAQALNATGYRLFVFYL